MSKKRKRHVMALRKSNAPIGFDTLDGDLVINEKEKKLVEFIFKDYAMGNTLQFISNYLNQIGDKTKRGNNFYPSSISKILDNELYLKHNIIHRNLWKKVQEKRCKK